MRTQGTGSTSQTSSSKKTEAKAAPKKSTAKAVPAKVATGSSSALERPALSSRAAARQARNERALAALNRGEGFRTHLCSPTCGHAAPGARRTELRRSGRVPERTAPKSIRAGGFTIHTTGIGRPGVLESVNLARRLSARPDIAQRLQRNKVDLVLLPHNQKLTDVPQFTQLRGKKTFDGRVWDDVRGVANVPQRNGRVAVALPEENLIELPSDGYQGNFSVGIHEVAHAVHGYGVTDKERRQILGAFNAQKRSGGAFTDEYASSNEYEYFAQATSAYLSRNVGQGKDGPDWVKKNDPRMYSILERVYGPPSKFESVDVNAKPSKPQIPDIPKPRVPKIEVPKIDPRIILPTTTVLRRGSSGDAVKALQEQLRAAGFLTGAADGLFGPQTDFAVRRYQKANNLKPDGIVGPKTWQALTSVQG